MAGVAPIAIVLGGIGAPTGYLLAGITLAIFAIGFTTMSRHVKSAGAFYAYITRGLGKPLGSFAYESEAYDAILVAGGVVL